MDDYEVEISGAEPVVEETPSEEPAVETPTETTEPEYELPDGRKVPGAEVLEAYKSLQADYTRKTQELASYKKSPETTPEYKNPDWQPQSYAEIIEKAKEELYRDMEERKQQELAVERQLAEQVDSQMAVVRQIDPNVNESKLFEHATKFKIPDLVSAYENMKYLNEQLEAVKQQTAKSIQKRISDPVATARGDETVIDENEVYTPSSRSSSLLDYLRQVKR